MKSNLITRAIFSMAALATGCCVSLAQETVKLLPPTYFVGKEYHITMEQDMSMDMSALGQAAGQPGLGGKTTTKMIMEMTMRCEKHSVEGQKRVKTVFKRVKMDVNAMGQNMGYDSAAPDEGGANPFAAAVAPMLKSEFAIIYDKDDNVISLEGFDQLAGGQGAAMSKLFDSEQFKQMANPAAALGIPASGIEVGKAWENVISMSLGAGVGNMKASYDLKYTKDEVIDGHECGVIDFTIDMEMDMKAGDGSANPMQMKMTGSDARGNMKLDKKLRHFRYGMADMKMKMDMTNPTDPTQTLTIPMEMKQTYKLTGVTDIK